MFFENAFENKISGKVNIFNLTKFRLNRTNRSRTIRRRNRNVIYLTETTIRFREMQNLILMLQAASTLPLCGVIWIIQIVQYPFYAAVNADSFRAYHAAHTFWITPVVAPLMIVELVTSILIIFYPPEAIDYKWLWLGLILSVAVWLSTFFLQVPLHDKLALGFDVDAHARLVKTNWIRTAAWSLRGALVLFLVWKSLR